jgi:hypothetical protein
MQSTKDKLEYLALLEEKKRRIRLGKPPYVPTPGQLRVLSSPKKEVFNFSGNGSGKTALNVQLAMLYAKGFNPFTKEQYKVPSKVAFVVDTSRKIDERIIPEFKKWFEIRDDQLKKDGRPYTSKLLLDNGSEIIFMTADADPMTMEGIELSAVVIDEPFPRILYIALKRSLRMKGHANKLIFSGTVISEPWLRKDIFEKARRGDLPDIECFNMKTEDNRANLDVGYIERFSSALTEAERKVRLEGQFFDSDGLALAEFFLPDVHIIKRDKWQYDYRMPCVISIDPHSAKPSTAIMIAVDRDNKAIALKELTLKANATQFALALKDFEKGYNVVDRVCDSAGNADMTSGEGMHSFIQGLQNNGVMVRGTTFQEKSHEDLIDRLRQGLAVPNTPDAFGRLTPALRVHEDCPKLISDIETVGWQRNRMTGETVAKLDTSTKDYLSCLGYGLALGIMYDITEHTKPRYFTDRLAPDNKIRREIDKGRDRIKEERASRVRTRFFRRVSRGG